MLLEKSFVNMNSEASLIIFSLSQCSIRLYSCERAYLILNGCSHKCLRSMLKYSGKLMSIAIFLYVQIESSIFSGFISQTSQMLVRLATNTLHKLTSSV